SFQSARAKVVRTYSSCRLPNSRQRAGMMLYSVGDRSMSMRADLRRRPNRQETTPIESSSVVVYSLAAVHSLRRDSKVIAAEDERDERAMGSPEGVTDVRPEASSRCFDGAASLILRISTHEAIYPRIIPGFDFNRRAD